ncbi:MAG: hypothetical protein JST54_35910 [Deltaproteobacteria bacterium]|nr:hypothetical protein [Deltaproteobacteria bacterium]
MAKPSKPAKPAKAFDPFADDDLEFQPESQNQATSIGAPPEEATRIKPRDPNEPRWKEVVERTAVKEAPKKPKHQLRLTFEELSDQGGDVRGATKIGSDKLAADEFLSGMKKQDLDEALERAQKSQRVIISEKLQETRVGRKVNTPIYIFWGAVLAFIGLLVGGGFVFKAWYDHSERQRIEALQKLTAPH